MKDIKTTDSRPKRTTLAPPPVPPPTPQPTKNPSSLLSPWWSAEPLPERKKPDATRRSLIRFTRIVQGSAHSSSSEPAFTERCLMLTKTKRPRSSSSATSAATDNGIPPAASDDCRMVCLLKDHQRQQQRGAAAAPQTSSSSSSSSWNPFQGLWLVVATTRARCLEHSAENTITQKKHADYFTVDLGERWTRSGEDAKRIATIALTPMQHLTQRYIQSWQDGTQAAFLGRFFECAVRGDAFHLMLDNAKKLLHHATKEEDTAAKKSSNGR